ncbi:unnamed protein product, partial [Mesorhabditis belari]|uniref:Uncharacterized protein n=1 Tax=Mesorhabditis belari TaxID=2138241 RepID=A0AAF3EX59_9BILA
MVKNFNQNAFEIECNLKVPSFFTHEECFKKTLAKQGLNGSKRKEWKTADCVENDCAGHLIFIHPIKKGGFYEKPVYCD